MGRGLRLEDVSRGKKMNFEANLCCLLNCMAFSRVEQDVSRGKKMYFATSLLNCKAFGGSGVKTRRCVSRQEDVL